MKILVIPNRGRSYNAVRPEAECYISLAQAGHDVTVMTCDSNAYFDEYKKAPLKLVELNSLKKYSWVVIKQVHQYIKKHNIDIVYATESNGIPNAAFGCIGTKAKMIAYRGTTGGMYKTDPSNYLCTLHPRINGYIGVSNAVTKTIKEKVRTGIKNTVQTIYKGHSLCWYQDKPTELSSLSPKLEPENNKFTVLCIGSPRPYKGMHYMLDAMKELNDLTDLHLVLVGDNFDCEPYASQVTATGMAEQIIQTGFRSDVPQIAAACDVLILPSEREGLPRVVLESLANATPVITSANEGAMEIIEEGQNGYIVPIGDGKAIADKIRFLYNNPAIKKQLSEGAVDTIKTKMSHEETVKQMAAFFQRILS
ncbi:glycosyltransferase family 4 protein [Colwellia sp. RSH04]|uniref:glycosyltransferase family 4 protein n=1 Tax=Colwellia sp. RSH04 TaxID=2305464 RepID=UPI000E57A57C|nr:glycosyltransferase family 4 protein [Colwellia sp. RSH04]RHW77667.1 glycosyltransferase family 1 protein [Colwellia sp. RSH04]